LLIKNDDDNILECGLLLTLPFLPTPGLEISGKDYFGIYGKQIIPFLPQEVCSMRRKHPLSFRKIN
jgi:hypothetical protein